MAGHVPREEVRGVERLGAARLEDVEVGEAGVDGDDDGEGCAVRGVQGGRARGADC